jgi:hypothetical protein
LFPSSDSGVPLSTIVRLTIFRILGDTPYTHAYDLQRSSCPLPWALVAPSNARMKLVSSCMTWRAKRRAVTARSAALLTPQRVRNEAPQTRTMAIVGPNEGSI